ncbi:MAG: hypothetical protein QNK37_30440 [Acidobacteriota bacterium]|nr:hypothetical protein [Acidobacteriota bacterium]
MHRWLIVVTLFLVTTALDAQDHKPGMTDRWNFSLGSFFQDVNTEARLDSDRGPGTGIDFEDDLGFNSSTREIRFDGYYRWKRHRIDFGYLRFRRESTKTLEETIEFGERTFEAMADIDAFFTTGFYKLGYRYSLRKSDRVDFGVAAGFSIFDLEAGLGALVEVTGENKPVVVDGYETGDVRAPVPVVGIHFNRCFERGLVFRATGEFFYLDLSEFTGSVLDTRVILDYYLSPRFGLGMGFSYVAFKVEEFRIIEDIPSRYEYRFAGRQIYATLSL